MSAVQEDYENALWNNSFYSLLRVITLLLLSHHIVNLKRTVNIPNLMLTTLVSAGLMDPHDAGALESHASAKKTSLMRISPSMKALDNVLNEKQAANVSEVILEEDAAGDLEPESRTNAKSLTNAESSQIGKPPGLGVYSASHTQPMSSVQTFHTAKSSDTVGSESNTVASQSKTAKSEFGTQVLPQPTQASHHRNSSSISTIGGSGYSTNESTPRLNEPAAFYTVKHTSKDFSPQLTSMTTSFPEKEVDSGDTKVVDSEHDETLLEGEKTGGLDQTTLTGHSKKKTVVSMLGPVPPTPPTPGKMSQGATENKLKEKVDNMKKNAAEKDVVKKTKGNDTKHVNGPSLDTSRPHSPVKSMLDALDSPRLEEPFGPSPLHAGDQSQSSAFATPRQITSDSPQTGGQSPAANLNKRSNTMSDLAKLKKGAPSSDASSAANSSAANSTVTNSSSGPRASKRFSFRGMFKIKSKNHSLDALGGVKEDADELKEDVKPSKPSKITAKSFSTPNFADFKLSKNETADRSQKPEKKHKDTSRSFFSGRRRKSEVELTAFQVEDSKLPNSRPVQKSLTSKQKQSADPMPKSASTAHQKLSPPTFAPKQALPPFPPSRLEEPTPKTPATTYSATSQFTPVTADLNPNTIREVDDLDYLPAFDQTDDFESDNGQNGYMERNVRPGKNFNATDGHKKEADGEFSDFGNQHINAEDSELFDPPKRRSEGSFGEDLTLDALRMPLDANHTSPLFGSPFAVSYSPSSVRPNQNQLSPPVDNLRLPSPKPIDLLKPSDLLIGEALFPKSLSAQEVESIVSLERSRSMRSIKSNGKKSSFINYMGSDENIVLGDNLLGISAGSMGRSGSVRRSGSILKNSLSSQSLRPEPVQLLDAAMNSEVAERNNDFNIDDSIHDFIEFSDFIDVDNLDFTMSPGQLDTSPAVAERGFTPVKIDFGEYGPSSLQPLQVTELQPLPEFELAQPDVMAETRADISADLQSEAAPLSEETAIRPDIVIVESETGLEAEDPQTPPHSLQSPQQDSLKSPILNAAYNMAMSQVVARESPSTAARPVSMSFKGFSGSAFKDKQVVQSGSHQLLNLYNDSSNESLAVGKGFGSSDEDSDDEDDYSFDDENSRQLSYRQSNASSSPALRQNETLTNKRQPPHPSNKFLSLHPPPSLSGPFHHDRIPSLSDHSATSSPRLLTSFISRIKKSPMGSPKMTFTAKSGVRFSSRIVLYDTYNGEEYDRHPDIATCNQLTPALAQQIKDELNDFKAEMHIHRDSQCYTHFF